MSRLGEGRPQPMGATVTPEGVNFSVWAPHAQQVELCLFDDQGQREIERFTLHGPHDGMHHGLVRGLRSGAVYGLRAHGPYLPAQGHRYNPHKLLLDPCARAIVGEVKGREEHHGHVVGHPDGIRCMDRRDNAATALKARVVDRLGAAERAALAAGRPRVPTAELLLYEMHVKGFSRQLPGVPTELQGTYAGLAHPASVAHLKALGVTTLSLLPVQCALDEPHLQALNKTNYWGYNTLVFFCVDPRWSCTPHDSLAAAHEFRAMVQALHAQGLEVVLDVVYNHTAEGGDAGPTLSFRGLDNAAWYRLEPDDPSRCENLSGCGNTLAVWQPKVTQFVLDSLRYWVEDMGVDGFRFDLATVLGRARHQGFDPDGAFLTALRQDPVLSQVHLISEPWDCGPQGYQVGRFPGEFLDWNDQYRDAVRAYWLHEAPGHNHRAPHRAVTRGDMARRFTASSDLFHHSQRRPSASVNFIAVHDGHTLRDVVSYHRKHNLANGEDNRDGRDSELSANLGVEGPTDDPAIQAARGRLQRAMLATLLLSQGTPMLCAGDEIGNTQHGNNNAYCQDNPLAWLDWAQADTTLLAFVQRAVALRRRHPLLHHNQWFHDHQHEAQAPKLRWLGPQGLPLEAADWHHGHERGFVCEFSAPQQATVVVGFNPHLQPHRQQLPGAWRVELDSAGDLLPLGATQPLTVHHEFTVPARSVVVLVQSPF